MRTLPLVPVFKDKLLQLKEKQAEYRRVCGKCYDKRYLEYICVDEMGTLISPHYLTSAFPKLLAKNSLISGENSILMECRDKKALKGQPFEDWILERRWWESNPRALADLSHFECFTPNTL